MEVVKIYLLFNRKDKPYLDSLLGHLKMLEKVELKDNLSIQAGKSRYEEIEHGIKECDILLVGISNDLLVSNIYERLKPLIFDSMFIGDNYLIPILLRNCLYDDFNNIVPLPKNNEFISSCKDKNSAFFDILIEIKKLTEACRNGDKKTTLKSQVLTLMKNLEKQRIELENQKEEIKDILYDALNLKGRLEKEIKDVILPYKGSIHELERGTDENKREIKELINNMIPLHRFYNTHGDDHAYITSVAEFENLKKHPNIWNYEGIAGYVMNNDYAISKKKK